MRVPLTAVMLVLTTASAASAQGGGDGKWGVKGGVNLATFRADVDAGDFGYRIGLIGGAFYTFALGDRVDIQPEALYSQQGATVDAAGGSGTAKLDYLSVPVLVRYRLSGSRS